ncbi:hypothetical protein ScoT_54970 [Streptomyces albidoflavus]|uniref:Uncharacterized protein n=1 Tax=Streptomyces albidoflavus TaxID=1886 RepID=A0AA37FGP9_9ACTN|nr:hypothetical protein ScoT_54970 [Streptomyces albidoflavus]
MAKAAYRERISCSAVAASALPAWNRPQHAPYVRPVPHGHGSAGRTATVAARRGAAERLRARRDMAPFSTAVPRPAQAAGPTRAPGGLIAGRDPLTEGRRRE